MKKIKWISILIWSFCYFLIYWLTAIPAELYLVEECKTIFCETLYLIHNYLFCLVDLFYDINLHQILTPLGVVMISTLIMGLITHLFVLIMTKYWFNKRK